MAYNLRDRTALVTGAGRGIGLQTARAFASLGGKVVLAELSEQGREAEQLIRSEGGQALYAQTDVSDANAVARLDFVLQLGVVSEQVTVTGSTSLVETEQGRVTASVDRMQLEEMLLNGRNIYNIIAIQPGITGRHEERDLSRVAGDTVILAHYGIVTDSHGM